MTERLDDRAAWRDPTLDAEFAAEAALIEPPAGAEDRIFAALMAGVAAGATVAAAGAAHAATAASGAAGAVGTAGAAAGVGAATSAATTGSAGTAASVAVGSAAVAGTGAAVGGGAVATGAAVVGGAAVATGAAVGSGTAIGAGLATAGWIKIAMLTAVLGGGTVAVVGTVTPEDNPPIPVVLPAAPSIPDAPAAQPREVTPSLAVIEAEGSVRNGASVDVPVAPAIETPEGVVTHDIVDARMARQLETALRSRQGAAVPSRARRPLARAGRTATVRPAAPASSAAAAPVQRTAPIPAEVPTTEPGPPTPSEAVPAERPSAEPASPARPSAELAPLLMLDPALAGEDSVLDRARSMLASGNAAGALKMTRQHRRRFPGGRMVEEREYIAIRALVALGETDEAATRAKTFLGRFRTSSYRAALEPLAARAER